MTLSRNAIIAIAAAVILVVGGIGAWFLLKSPDGAEAPVTAAATPSGPLPDPVIVVVSMDAVTQASKVGQSIITQMQAMADQAKQELGGEAQALQREEAAVTKLPSDQRLAKLEALAPRRTAFQQKAQAKDAQLKGAFAMARADLGKTIEPILRQIVTARGANLVMDRRAASMLTDPKLDISQDVVTALDAKIQTYTVKVPPPQGAAQ
jgi:outer membrane protein